MSQKRSQRLNPIVKLAGHKEKTSAKNLGKARNQHSAIKNQLQDLLEYRKSYADLLQNKAQQGISSGQFCLYQNFLVQLDNAIKQQRQSLTQSDETVKQNVKGWKNQHQKQQRMENMNQRIIKAENQASDKAQQRRTDKRRAC